MFYCVPLNIPFLNYFFAAKFLLFLLLLQNCLTVSYLCGGNICSKNAMAKMSKMFMAKMVYTVRHDSWPFSSCHQIL